ncbi:hypothetical protein FGB62_157g15 [Gracilaria domingensis]|nr:hypothetical protein FGB62_157g15 [Gracilaria domingensis]
MEGRSVWVGDWEARVAKNALQVEDLLLSYCPPGVKVVRAVSLYRALRYALQTEGDIKINWYTCMPSRDVRQRQGNEEQYGSRHGGVVSAQCASELQQKGSGEG